MTFVPFSNTAQVEMIYTLDEQVVENTLYFQNTGALTVSELTDIADIVKIWALAHLLPELSSSLALQEIKATSLASSTAPLVEYTSGLPANGGQTGEYMPNLVAACITFLTESRGRSHRGRNYLPGLSTGDVDYNVMRAGWVTGMETVYGYLLSAVESTDWTWVVASRISGGAPRGSGVVTPITAVRVNPQVATQRRRRPGHGS